ncbi:MAG: metal ABC transporter ATP-binding protein [Elusimicrobiota bacterium]
MPETLIQFKEVTFAYGKKTVFSDLSFSINKNDFIGIVGANGSGKTTILKGILGLIKPQNGRIDKPDNLVYGYVPQSNTIDNIFPFTVLEIVKMGLYNKVSIFRRFNKEEKERIFSVLEQTGIEAYTSIPYRDLSGGLKQRALLARALVNEPGVLVLDEPTNDLDISSEKAIMDLIKGLHETEKITVIMVSHLVNVVINYVKNIGFIDTDKFEIHPIDSALSETELWKTYHSKVHLGSVCGKRVVIAE